MFSATLHSAEIKTMAETICRFPQWVDLKGKPTVPPVRLALSKKSTNSFLER